MMPVTLNRSICCDLNETISREWLVTNGLGAYATGTVAGVLTRMEHGLLVARTPQNDIPQLLLAKIDEEVVFDQRTYYLGTNEYRDGTLNPSGFVHLETFRLEEGFPVFTYRFGGIDGIMLEKRIWMQQGRDTTYIQYRLIRTTHADETGYRRSGITGALSNGPSRNSDYSEFTPRAITLTLLPLTAHRPYNQTQHGNNDWHFSVQQYQGSAEDTLDADGLRDSLLLPEGVAGCTIRAWENAHPYHLFAVGLPEGEVSFIPTNVWYWNFLHRQDAAAGRSAHEDLYLPGVIRATLWPDDDATLTIIVSTEDIASLTLRPQQLSSSYTRSVEGQRQLFSGALTHSRYFGDGGEAAHAQRLSVLPLSTTTEDEAFLHSLLRANERFLLQHKLSSMRVGTDLSRPGSDHERLFGRPESVSDLLTNFYGMERTTRDALIALPGLMIATGRYNELSRILRNLAQYFQQGMLPDTLPLPDKPISEYTYWAADTLLWYCYALDAYLQNSQNYELLKELYPRIVEAINCYIRGNEYGVQMDEQDGLLALSGDASTWMNASSATLRSGKPVEVNALWYNALSLLHEWSQRLARSNRPAIQREQTPYRELLLQCKASFQQRFWYNEGGYLFDVVDGPHGNDTELRPNQLLACSLRYAVLDDEQCRSAILDKVTKNLLTPYGLRTLAPDTESYRGYLGTSLAEQRDALHQGSVWTWLLGPYIDALYKTAHASATPNDAFWKRSIRQLQPFQRHLSEGMLDMIGGVFDGDAPHAAGYVPASLLSNAELVRVYATLTQITVRQPHLVQSR